MSEVIVGYKYSDGDKEVPVYGTLAIFSKRLKFQYLKDQLHNIRKQEVLLKDALEQCDHSVFKYVDLQHYDLIVCYFCGKELGRIGNVEIKKG